MGGPLPKLQGEMMNTPIYDRLVVELGFDPETVSEPWTIKGCMARAKEFVRIRREAPKPRQTKSRGAKKR